MPLGLCLVASALAAREFHPRVLDLCFSRNPHRDIAAAITTFTPAAIGLSIRNLDNGDYLRPRGYIAEAAAMSGTCRRHSDAPLIIGGPAVSIAPEQMRKRLRADYAITGDGEEALADLLTGLADGGAACRSARLGPESEAACSAPHRISDLDGLSLAEIGRWIDLRPYLRRGSPMPVQSKRGCAFECTYCTYRFIEGPRYRLRNPEAVVAEMSDAVSRWRIPRFEFVDSTFNHPPDYAMALCEAILRSGLRAELQTMNLNPAGTSPELLGLMRRAGFRSVTCAPDSGCDGMLERLHKGFDAEQIARTAAWARETGLSVQWSFIFGGPGETEATVRETLRFIETALGPEDRILCTLGLRIYPRTDLERTARAEGLVTPHDDLIEPAFYLSPHISPARILELVDGSARRSQMLYLESLQRPFIAWAMQVHAMLGLRSPAWQAVPLYNRLTRRRHSDAPPPIGQTQPKPEHSAEC
jgi:radical SAM superfamily enzyme YgiQ (UPF0313 family)